MRSPVLMPLIAFAHNHAAFAFERDLLAVHVHRPAAFKAEARTPVAVLVQEAKQVGRVNLGDLGNVMRNQVAAGIS
jgi:hypothetical protein